MTRILRLCFTYGAIAGGVMAVLLFLARLARADSCELPPPDIFDQARSILGAISGLAYALIPIAMLKKGPEPQRTLRAIADFLGRYSRK